MAAKAMNKKTALHLVVKVEGYLRAGFVPRGQTPPKGSLSAISELGREMGWPRSTAMSAVRRAEQIGRGIRWGLYIGGKSAPPAQTAPAPRADLSGIEADLLRKSLTIEQVAAKMGGTTLEARAWLEGLAANGTNIAHRNGKWQIAKTQPMASIVGGPRAIIESDANNRYRFGLSGDQHLCSKYARLDVLNGLYDRFARAGVQHVFNTGNWIDGEARFNTHDLLVHGFDAQLRYLAEHFPRRDGIHTHAVWGDDHEGWYGQRFGVDVGRRAEQVMRDAGRHDWSDLGFMESNVILRNSNTGKEAVMMVVHPGGGSAYATSYTMQKLVESLDGGEKPAIVAAGHYHKMEVLNVRNVWAIQTGTTQDQTPFMRKKRLEAHVGGVLVECEQDPDTGAIVELNGMQRYFVQGYYNEKFSHSGPVNQARRGVRA